MDSSTKKKAHNIEKNEGAEFSGKKVTVIGGGLSGAMIALMLVQQGYRVALFERRKDPRKETGNAGRSINLGLSKRGIQALKKVGLYEKVMSRTVKMKGRVVHLPDGSLKYQPYGKSDKEVLYSVDRNELNRELLEYAESYDELDMYFEHKFTSLDKVNRTLTFEVNGGEYLTSADLVIGSDGAFSAVRREMHRGERAAYNQEFLEWGYKELTLLPNSEGHSRIKKSALHVWPSNQGLIVSHPNLDGSHTLTLFLPFEGENSFSVISDKESAEMYFKNNFSSLNPWLEEILQHWEKQPVGSLVTTKTDRWVHDDWVVLIGDASHAQYPFYGQGMNSAFEDCCLLMEQLMRQQHRATALKSFEKMRKPHTDALADLSKENFVELRQKVRSPMFVARKKMDLLMHRVFPTLWIPLYGMISHTTMPYADARQRAKLQDKILNAAVAVLVITTALLLVAP